jgi:hypothetical protein
VKEKHKVVYSTVQEAAKYFGTIYHIHALWRKNLNHMAFRLHLKEGFRNPSFWKTLLNTNT